MGIRVRLLANTTGIAVKPSFAVAANTTSSIVIKNIASTISTGGRLDSLQDVVSTNETEGAVPVYNSANDTYVVQKLDISNITGDLDGGTF